MPKFQDSGRCIGYAHVLMTDESAYNYALSLNRQSLGGRYLDIKAAQGITKVDFKTS
jgi:predicted DNA-binding helix-hairpin-helix protein